MTQRMQVKNHTNWYYLPLTLHDKLGAAPELTRTSE